MRMTNANDEKEVLDFAKKAAKWFKENPEGATFSGEYGLAPGTFLALRWGLGNDCVVVVRLHEDTQPVNFQGLVKEVE